MRKDLERALRVKSISHEIIQELLTDGATYNEQQLKQTVELLSRSIHDLTNVYSELEADHESTLKATIAKMRMALNSLKTGKTKKVVENESVSVKKV